MVINHSYIPYISANGFVSPTFNYGDIVKISNSKEIAPKSRLFENPYFFQQYFSTDDLSHSFLKIVWWTLIYFARNRFLNDF